jgi:hypothetical protein
MDDIQFRIDIYTIWSPRAGVVEFRKRFPYRRTCSRRWRSCRDWPPNLHVICSTRVCGACGRQALLTAAVEIAPMPAARGRWTIEELPEHRPQHCSNPVRTDASRAGDRPSNRNGVRTHKESYCLRYFDGVARCCCLRPNNLFIAAKRTLPPTGNGRPVRRRVWSVRRQSAGSHAFCTSVVTIRRRQILRPPCRRISATQRVRQFSARCGTIQTNIYVQGHLRPNPLSVIKER